MSRLKDSFQLNRLLPALAAGLVSGVLTIVMDISLAALLFSGDMRVHVPRGIGLTLFGSLVMGVVVALTSSYAGSVATTQDSPAAILSVMVAAIAAGTSASLMPGAWFVTVAVTVALSTVLTGLFFLLLGAFNLGGLTRYIPYPVVGGFLAGTGWLLALGGMSVMVDASFDLARLSHWLQLDMLIRWLPGLLFAVLLVVVVRRYSHFLVVPGMLAAAVALFYLVLWGSGATVAQLSAQGWLLGPYPSGALWQPLSLSAIRGVDWSVVFSQIGGMGTIIIVSTISLLLNAGGIGLTVRKELDLNRELKSAGLANVLVGLGGGTPGFHALSLSVLGHRVGADSRLVGLISAGLCGAMLFFGASLLSFFPKVVLGGLILFLGLSFLVEWVIDGWFKLSRADYAIVWLIMITMSAIGVLEGVGLGLVLAVGLFVVNYSRTDVVKHALSGSTFHSAVDRPLLYHQLLRQKGDWTYILELQGFIFFGTADKLLDRVRQRFEDPAALSPRYLVLDFHHVVGLDASALLSFAKMKQLAEAREVALVFTALSPRMERRLKQDVLQEDDEVVWRIFSDLDRGVEWCEEKMIQTFEEVGLTADYRASRRRRTLSLVESGAPESLLDFLAPEAGEGLPPEESTFVACLDQYAEWLDVAEGTRLIRQGEVPQALYFIQAGGATAFLEGEDDQPVRLKKMMPGTVVGEVGFYLGVPATASVVTDQPGRVARLSAESLEQMEAVDPATAAVFHKLIVQLLGERLSNATDTIEALMR